MPTCFAISGYPWQWVETKWHWLATQDHAKLVYEEVFTSTFSPWDKSQSGLCALRHGIKNSMEAMLACHPALSTEWLAGWKNCVNYGVSHAPLTEFTTCFHQFHVFTIEPRMVFIFMYPANTTNSNLQVDYHWFESNDLWSFPGNLVVNLLVSYSYSFFFFFFLLLTFNPFYFSKNKFHYYYLGIPNKEISISLIEGVAQVTMVRAPTFIALCTMGPVRIRHSSHDFGWQSSHSVDLAGWQAKMASIEIWIPWRNAHKPHLPPK